MYTKYDFIRDCHELFSRCDGNSVVIPGTGQITMYEQPLTGFASAADEIFETYRRPEVVGANYLTPAEWLPEAKTVVSFFLPFTEAVRVSNRADASEPSTEWLYARVEGQEFINGFIRSVGQMLTDRGFAVCIPPMDPRFGFEIEMTMAGDAPDFHVDSKWSERHAAYACGLGTFGLSRGLITERGMAGRFCSIVVSAEFEPDRRKYTGVYDYCIKCGACFRKCPVQAISLEHAKNNVRCNGYVEKMTAKYKPRYGCGKCQVGVPCETMAPGLAAIEKRQKAAD